MPLKFQRNFSLYMGGQKNSAVRCRRKFQEGYPYTGKNVKMMVYVFFVLGMRSKHRKNTYSFTNRRIFEDRLSSQVQHNQRKNF